MESLESLEFSARSISTRVTAEQYALFCGKPNFSFPAFQLSSQCPTTPRQTDDAVLHQPADAEGCSMNWLAKAKAHFSETAQAPTDKRGVSAVSSVGVTAIFENRISVEELIQAAMRACDHWGDSDEARQEMKRQCLEVPPHLREELREHFEHNYPGRGRDND